MENSFERIKDCCCCRGGLNYLRLIFLGLLMVAVGAGERAIAQAIGLQNLVVLGNQQEVANGDLTPSLLDGTDFGVVPAGGAPVTRVFSIYNNGPKEVLLDQASVQGPGFEITTMPQAVLPGYGSGSFVVRLTPILPGLTQATVRISSSSDDVTPFSYRVQADVKAAAVSVSGGGSLIAAGDSTPSTGDGTDFGTVLRGKLAERQFTLSNTGGADLVLTRIDINGNGFSLVGNWPMRVLPGTSQTFRLGFSPLANGAATGSVSVITNDPLRSPYTFSLGAFAREAKIAVTGNSVPIAIGDTTPELSDATLMAPVTFGVSQPSTRFVVRNSGDGNLAVSGIVLSDPVRFRLSGGQVLPANIAPGGSLMFDLACQSLVAGVFKTMVTIESDANNAGSFAFQVEASVLAASGSFGALANGDMNPSVVEGTAFGLGLVNGAAVTRGFPIASMGPGELVISGVTVEPSVHFTVPGGYPRSLASGGSTDIQIQFQPKSVGNHTAMVTIHSNDPAQSPFTFVVGGSGNARTLAVGEIPAGDLSPGLVDGTDFGPALMGSNGLTRTWPLRNLGNIPLRITSITSSQAKEFVILSPPLGDLSAGGSANLVIRFKPSGLGDRNATITLASDDPLAPFVFAVHGTGIARNAVPSSGFSPVVLSQVPWSANLAGDFTGAIYQDDGNGNAGEIVRGGFDSFRVIASGAFSARGALDGIPFAMKGSLNTDGSYRGEHLLRDGSLASISIGTFIGSDGTRQIAGSLINKGETFHVSLVLGSTVVLPDSIAGRYTMVIPANDDAPSGEPKGDGVASLTVRIDGRIQCRFLLGDGSSFSRKGRVTPGYGWQFHFPVYQKGWAGGYISGRMTFRDVPAISDFDGQVYWKKAPDAASPYYPGGFAVGRVAVGCKYRVPPTGSSVLPSLSDRPQNAQLVLGEVGEGSSSGPLFLSWTAADKITFAGTNPSINLKVNRKTGIVSGRFLDVSSGSAVGISAAVFQKQGRCAGRFKGYGVTGYVSILPVPAATP